ncbi:MAG TPA: hypothetical protein VD763_08245 [Candidatus Saccharimonadales bacterium]|nr:hypothetical protein [Candidatus Saccharimonadales bacterium]
MPTPALIALVLIVGLIVLVPARRLQTAGLRPAAIGAYALVLWVLGMALALRPVASRILVPVLILLYVAPFIPAPGVIRRVLGGSGRPAPGRDRGPRRTPTRPPMKNVTPPDVGVPPDPGAPP